MTALTFCFTVVFDPIRFTIYEKKTKHFFVSSVFVSILKCFIITNECFFIEFNNFFAIKVKIFSEVITYFFLINLPQAK